MKKLPSKCKQQEEKINYYDVVITSRIIQIKNMEALIYQRTYSATKMVRGIVSKRVDTQADQQRNDIIL
jgi:hypothetical protein